MLGPGREGKGERRPACCRQGRTKQEKDYKYNKDNKARGRRETHGQHAAELEASKSDAESAPTATANNDDSVSDVVEQAPLFEMADLE